MCEWFLIPTVVRLHGMCIVSDFFSLGCGFDDDKKRPCAVELYLNG